MEDVTHKAADEDLFIDINEYNLLFCDDKLGPKVVLKELDYKFNTSCDTLDDLAFNSILNSIEVISSIKEEDKGSSKNSIIVEKERVDFAGLETQKDKRTETMDISVLTEKKSCFPCFSQQTTTAKKRLRTADSYYSTNVNNTKRSSYFSKSIKLNDSLVKIRKKRSMEKKDTKAKTNNCGCNIF
jgi:hypothetical protein